MQPDQPGPPSPPLPQRHAGDAALPDATAAPWLGASVWGLGLGVIVIVWAAPALQHSATTLPALAVTLAVAASLVLAHRLLRSLHAEHEAATEATRRAVAADQAKSRFLALVSRELRAPLDTILAEGETLASGASPETGLAIAREARRLLGAVDALLDFAALGRGPVVLRETSFLLGPLLDEAAAEVEALVAPTSRGLRIDPALRELALHADRRAIRQVLLQLTANAARFSRHEDWIDLRLERDPGRLVLVVEDEGIGIPASDLARVVEAFERAGAPLSARGGTGLGLGLSISRALVEAHGGRLELQSVEGVGTRVAVFLPATRETLPDAPDATPAARGAGDIPVTAEPPPAATPAKATGCVATG